MDGWLGGWGGGWVDGWLVGWIDGWIHGWMDAWEVSVRVRGCGARVRVRVIFTSVCTRVLH